MSRNKFNGGQSSFNNHSMDFLYSSIDPTNNSMSYLNIDSTVFESNSASKKTTTPSKNTYVSRRVNPYEQLPRLKNNSVQTSLKQLPAQTEEFHAKTKKTLLSRLSYGVDQEDADSTDYLVKDKYHHTKQRSFIKNLHSFKDVLAHLNAYPTTNISIENNTSPKANGVSQTVINKDFQLKSKCEKLTRWLDDQEYTFEYTPPIHYASTYIERVASQKEHLSLYLSKALSKFQQMLNLPAVSTLFEKIINGLRGQTDKLISLQEQEIHRLATLNITHTSQLAELQAKIDHFQSQISGEQQYLEDLFVKVSKDAITQKIEDFQNSQSIKDIMQGMNTNGHSLDRYSGLNIYLNEIYAYMNLETANNHDQKASNPPNFRSHTVIQGVKQDYLQKLKDVQNATAIRVLQRFYKNIEYAEASTQVEEDPVMLQLQETQLELANEQQERIKDQEQVNELLNKIEVINTSLSRLHQQLRESKAEGQYFQDQLSMAESKLRQLEYEYTKTVEKVERYKDELRRVTQECSEAKQKIQLQNDQINNLKIAQSLSNEKIGQLEASNHIMETQISELNLAKNVKRVPLLVRKPIYNENREQIGEAYIEQEMSISPGNEEFDFMGGNGTSSSTPFTNDDQGRFQHYCRENGITNIDNVHSFNDLKDQIQTSFNRLQGQELEDFMKNVQLVQRYFLRLQSEKNDISQVGFTAPSKQKQQKQQIRRKRVEISHDAQIQDNEEQISSKHLSSRLNQQTPPRVSNPVISDLVSSHNMQINSNAIMSTPPSMPLKMMSAVNQGGQTSSSQMSNFVSYLHITRNKLNNPDLPISQSVLQSRYFGGARPFVKGRKGIDLHTQTDGFNTTNFIEDNQPLIQTLSQDKDCQTDQLQGNADHELRRKLLEFIGGKLAKQGDTYDKGSALFTKASQIIEMIQSSPIQRRVNGITPLKCNTYEPILKKSI